METGAFVSVARYTSSQRTNSAVGVISASDSRNNLIFFHEVFIQFKIYTGVKSRYIVKKTIMEISIMRLLHSH